MIERTQSRSVGVIAATRFYRVIHFKPIRLQVYRFIGPGGLVD